MEAVETLKRTISVTEELHSLVKTMKVLAGVNIRQYERAAHAVACNAAGFHGWLSAGASAQRA